MSSDVRGGLFQSREDEAAAHVEQMRPVVKDTLLVTAQHLDGFSLDSNSAYLSRYMKTDVHRTQRLLVDNMWKDKMCVEWSGAECLLGQKTLLIFDLHLAECRETTQR